MKLIKKITSLIIITPSIASKRSFKITSTNVITTCILSISCFRKIVIGAVAPNIRNLSSNISESVDGNNHLEILLRYTFVLLQMDHNLVAISLTFPLLV